MATQEIIGTGAIVLWVLIGLLGILVILFHKKMIHGHYGYKVFRKTVGENKFMDKVYEKLGLVTGIGITIFAVILIILEIINYLQ